MTIPINIEILLSSKKIESQRKELKQCDQVKTN